MRVTKSTRWDDARRSLRTKYWAQSLLAALIEVLAAFRPAPADGVLETVIENADDEVLDAVQPAGAVSESWLEGRMLAKARLRGRFCNVATARSLAALDPLLVRAARRRGAADFDLSAVTDSADRTFTQLIASWLYRVADQDEEPLLHGVQYPSRHGRDLTLWAIFEQPAEGNVSPHLTANERVLLRADAPEVQRASTLLELHWPNDSVPRERRSAGAREVVPA